MARESYFPPVPRRMRPPKPLPPEPPHGLDRRVDRSRYKWAVLRMDYAPVDEDPERFCPRCERYYGLFDTLPEAIAWTRKRFHGLWYKTKKVYVFDCSWQ